MHADGTGIAALRAGAQEPDGQDSGPALPARATSAQHPSETEEWRSAKLAELPMGRFGTVAEVTPTAVLLASEDGAYYTGQTLGPNGGDVML